MVAVDPNDRCVDSCFFPWLKAVLTLLLLLAMVSVQQRTVAAQREPETTPAVAAPTLAGDAVTADEVNLVARELWCPLCSGVRLDSCELKACDQMKEVIALKLAEGEDTASIRTYFVAQYGPQVLGAPPLEGFNWLAWILPFVVLAFGGYLLWHTIRRMTRPASISAAASSPGSAPATPAERAAANDIPDEYAEKLAEELKRYE